MSTADRLERPGHLPAGVALRGYGGAPDAPGLAAVRAACARVDGVDPFSSCEMIPTAEHLEAALSPGKRFDPARDVIVAEARGEIVGYGAVSWWRETSGCVPFLVRGWTRPDWRRRGIGTALLRWGEGRAGELAADLPAGLDSVLAANASETERDAAALLCAHGYRVAFTILEMERPGMRNLPDPTLPPGFVLRRLEPAHLPELFRVMDECYMEYPFKRVLDDQNYAAWAAEEGNPDDWHVAWDEAAGVIAGQVRAAPNKGRGEIWECSVAKPYRGRGLATALLGLGLRSLEALGQTVTRLHTMRENPTRAWALYERVGFRVIKRFDRYRKAMVAS